MRLFLDQEKRAFTLSHSKLHFYFSGTNESRIESSRQEFVEMVVVSCTASVRFFRIKAQTDLCQSILIFGAEVTLYRDHVSFVCTTVCAFHYETCLIGKFFGWMMHKHNTVPHKKNNSTNSFSITFIATSVHSLVSVSFHASFF
jgi:hypothetical protein